LEVQIQLKPKKNDKKIGAIKDASLKANKKKTPNAIQTKSSDEEG
jgi:hypothetical protein